jgi:3-oxoacyl-[acyl-carrier protein] reductase
MMRLQNQVAIITGGANGIGLAACERFAKEGAKIVMADFDDKAGIEQQKILQDKGYDITFIQVNVADRESVDNLVSKTVETYGGVNILVNNAGITRDAMLAKMTPTDFQHVLDVNVTGVFNCTQAFFRFY